MSTSDTYVDTPEELRQDIKTLREAIHKATMHGINNPTDATGMVAILNTVLFEKIHRITKIS